MILLNGPLLDSTLKTTGPGEGMGVEAIRDLGLKVADETSTADYWKDPAVFELWYREQGLLIEINDADYAEPKLAVIS